jgi:transitional endoplasmic reticulum ATPase
MTPKDQTGFDAFFQAVTRSPEFKSVVTTDWKGEAKDGYDAGIVKMEASVKKASELVTALEASFKTPEAIATGESLSTDSYESPSHGQAKEKEKEPKEKPSVDVKYFTMKNPETWGFKGIAGMDDLKKELSESFIAPLRFKFLMEKLKKEAELVPAEGTVPSVADPKIALYRKLSESYDKFQVSIPTGLLFYGPPGTGKTFITKKLTEELGAGFIQKSVGEFGSSYMHETTKNIKAFFTGAKEAAENGPIVLFLDEIDSLLSSRTQHVDASKAEEVSQFLQEFNDLASAQNLIVIAATNRPDHLDSAILRSGRLDKKIYIAPPDFTARKEMFRMYIERLGRPHGKLDYDQLATLTEGYVSSDIETICDEVARDASQSILTLAASMDNADFDAKKIEKQLSKEVITMKRLTQAITDTVSSLKMVDMGIYTKWLEKIDG